MHQLAIGVNEAAAFLTHHYGEPGTAVALIGEGAWSRCFGFRLGEAELVVRFGRYVDDFEKDRRAYRYASAALPIPEVLAIDAYGEGFFAISRRVYGVPLESVAGAQWRAVVPSLVGVLEGLREADISASTGFGGWGRDGRAAQESWAEHLLLVNRDTPAHRTHGWRERLAANSPEGAAAFAWGYALLQNIARDDVPRCLLHCDLMNRNVLVMDNQISGVFDWGCSCYGDHLYELAWFEFWAPWTPQLDMAYLRQALEARWRAVGYAPTHLAQRLQACYLHIGLDHLAYNAYLGDWVTLRATAERMRVLVN